MDKELLNKGPISIDLLTSFSDAMSDAEASLYAATQTAVAKLQLDNVEKIKFANPSNTGLIQMIVKALPCLHISGED